MMKNLILMGFMGAGKSTIGKCLAKELSIELLDTDDWIEQAQGRKISDIFAQDGERVFRDMETALLKELLQRTTPFVLSIGGGMPVREENRALLRRLGTVVYLKTSKEEIIKRVSGSAHRPLLQGGALEEKVSALMAAREQIYIETAHAEVITDRKTPDRLVGEILQL